jgi:hypothetical protein
LEVKRMVLEYKVFDKTYLCKRAVGYSMRQIKDETLRELYRLFKVYVDNVHTDLDTAQVHFLEDDSGEVDLLWTCSHYEAVSTEDIAGLLHFLLEIKYYLGNVEVVVDLLDGVAEKLIIKIFDSPYEYPESASKVKMKGEG